MGIVGELGILEWSVAQEGFFLVFLNGLLGGGDVSRYVSVSARGEAGSGERADLSFTVVIMS